MASVRPGFYTFEELFRVAKFNVKDAAGADYLDGQPDLRRVQVGGLGFDSLEQGFVVPPTTDEVVISVDGSEAAVVKVELDEEAKKLRAYSFETAADTDGPARQELDRLVVEDSKEASSDDSN